MNQAHVHLVFNHLPIIFPMVGLVVLLTGYFYRSEIVKRTSMFVFILGSVFSIIAIATGEGAEDIVKSMPGVTENYINTHESAANIFSILSYILGLISLTSLWASWKQKTYAKLGFAITLFFCLIVLYFAKVTGTSGGEIRHTEIRATLYPATEMLKDSSANTPAAKEEDDD